MKATYHGKEGLATPKHLARTSRDGCCLRGRRRADHRVNAPLRAAQGEMRGQCSMDTALVLRRRVLYGPRDSQPAPPAGHEGWEYWWSHPPGLFWNLDAVLCSLGVPDDFLSDLLDSVGPASKQYRALMQLAHSACERVRLRVQVADALPDWQPPAGWEPLSRPRDEYLYLWRVVRDPEPQAMRAALQAASTAVESWRRFGGWL